jgi:hypothetical protein
MQLDGHVDDGYQRCMEAIGQLPFTAALSE